MTTGEAQAIQDDAVRRGEWIIWFVTAEAGQVVATARRADQGGQIVGQLVANTLDELRAMLPSGLTQRETTSVMSPEVIETWD